MGKFITVEFAQNSQFYLLTKPWGVDCGCNAIDSTISTSERHYFIYYSWVGSENCFRIGAHKIFKRLGLRMIKLLVIKHKIHLQVFSLLSQPSNAAVCNIFSAHSTRKDIGCCLV